MLLRRKSGSARTPAEKSPRPAGGKEAAKLSLLKVLAFAASAHCQFSRPASRYRQRWLTSSFRGRPTSAISNTTTPVVQIQSKWPPRKLLSALPRRTSPWAPRSARVRIPISDTYATREQHNRQWPQKSHTATCTNNTSLQASSSSALPVSSPPSTTPSSTSPIFRTSEPPPWNRELERNCGIWHIRKMVQRLTWVIPVAVRPSPVSPVA
jgi:hypothetical protein